MRQFPQRGCVITGEYADNIFVIPVKGGIQELCPCLTSIFYLPLANTSCLTPFPRPEVYGEAKYFCQEQIEMSGFVANELSAFTVHKGSMILEQELSGGRALSSMVFRARSYPQPFSRSLYGARREMVVGNSVKLPF